MNNSAVHKSLIEIEENLKNLQSAKNQVENVLNVNESLIVSVKNIVKNLDALSNEFNNNKSSFNDTLNSYLTEFTNTLNSERNNFINKTDDFNKELNVSVNKTTKSLFNFQAEILKLEEHIKSLDFEKSLNELTSLIDVNFSEQKSDFNQKRLELKSDFFKKQNELKDDLTTSSNKIKEIDKKLDDTNDSIKESFHSSDEKITAIKEDLQLSLKNNFRNTQIAMGIGFLFVIIIYFITK